MGRQRRERVRVLIGGALLLVAATGCPFTLLPVPEAALHGTWELTGDLVSPDLRDFVITFDKEGQIVEVQYVFEATTTFTIASAEMTSRVSQVEGQNVSVSATWGRDYAVMFVGRFNDAEDQIDGTAGYWLGVGASITGEIVTGQGTLTRQ